MWGGGIEREGLEGGWDINRVVDWFAGDDECGLGGLWKDWVGGMRAE